MNNLKIKKRLMALALANTFALTGLSNVTSYAEQKNEEIIDITEFEDIRDIVVAKDERVAIKDRPGSGHSLLGILEPGEYLKLIADCENNYEVLYKGRLAYVNKNYVYVSTLDDININNLDAKDIVTAIENVEIKSLPTNNSETIGTLRIKESLKTNGKKDGYYEVIYNNEIGYIEDNKIKYQEKFEKSGYINKDTYVYKTVNLDKQVSEIKELEFVRIYDETEDAYYINNNEVSGYINKADVELLSDIYIVTDISDQIVEMYNNNDLLLSTSVVTGKPPKNSTPTGVYYIGDEAKEVTDHRYLVGDGYKSYVDYMMKFTGNIGFHDSECGVDEYGTYHGWRNSSEYGGTTYLTNGSHGCVNMQNAAAEDMYNVVYPYVVEEGNLVKVLVKE